MNTLYWLITITDRHSTDAFLALYEEHGITVSLRTVGAGTAVRETLSTLGLEQTEKAVLFAMITAETWPGLQKDLRRKMRIDVPGTGIAFIIPVSSIGGKRALQFLTEHQTFALKEESTLKDTRYELLLVIANQGHTGSIMDAARAAGAGGGTVIHAKGTGMEGAAHFMGVELVNEKELVLIVSRTTLKNQIMQAIMQGADPKAGAIVFSLPVTDTAGLRLLDEEYGLTLSGASHQLPQKGSPWQPHQSRCSDGKQPHRVDFLEVFLYYKDSMGGTAMKSTRRWQQLLLNSLAIILGNALYSLAVALFLEPAGLITGGATGIALAFGRLTGLSVSGFLFLFNMSMLVWGWAVLGKKFALNTLASSVLSPAFLGLFERLLDGRVLTEDIFLCTIFSGLGIGVALGMVIRAGASTGGMDIPPLVLQKWFRWPVSITMMLFDIAILLVQAAFSQPEQVLYGIVLVITHTIVMDKMLMLGDSRTEVKIISTRSNEIRTAILAEIDRGVTVLHGEGGYTGEPSEVLLSVISNRELPRLEKLVHSIDPACFLIVSRVTEVSGRGFSMEKEYQ